jgi:hypothetical protein
LASDFFCDEFLPFGPPQKKTKENFEFFSINPTKKMLKFWKNHQTFETTKIKKKKKKKKNYIQDVEKQFRNWFTTKSAPPFNHHQPLGYTPNEARKCSHSLMSYM